MLDAHLCNVDDADGVDAKRSADRLRWVSGFGIRQIESCVCDALVYE